MTFTREKFNEYVKGVYSRDGYRRPVAFGICRVYYSQIYTEQVISAMYLSANYQENEDIAAAIWDCAGVLNDGKSAHVIQLTEKIIDKILVKLQPFSEKASRPYDAESGKGVTHENVRAILAAGVRAHTLKPRIDQQVKQVEIANQERISGQDPVVLPDAMTNPYQEFQAVFIFDDEEPKTLQELFLYFTLMSLQKIPNTYHAASTSLLDKLGIKPVAWVGANPVDLDYLRANKINMLAAGNYPVVDYVGQLPKYLQCIVPPDKTIIRPNSDWRLGDVPAE